MPSKVQAIKLFIGMVSYYRDMWPKRSQSLAPLTDLTSKNVPFKWKEHHQVAFEETKRLLCAEVMLSYPDFTQPFHIYTDARDIQLGAVITQNDKPLAFYSRKLNSAQRRYTTGEQELLSIVETLREFRNTLLGHQIIVHTDHKNLTYEKSTSDRIMRWRLFLEEYGPEFRYIQGKKNFIADALSRLDKSEEDISEATSDPQMLAVFLNSQETVELDLFPDIEIMAECFGGNVTEEQKKI
jgi:hypothetical protein